jgi:muramoyltetrapeptide carboxypeptidase LdcA involved in peptidoglycan recycling
MHANLKKYLRSYFEECVSILEGCELSLSATLVRGDLPDSFNATFVGGNLTVLSTMIGSRYADSIDPAGRWLMIEDYNDKPERFDRYLSHLSLAGYWQRCEGVLLGDFHQNERDLTQAVIEMLRYHIPNSCPVPVLVASQIGHTWPMAPLPLHAPCSAIRTGGAVWSLRWTLNLASTECTRVWHRRLGGDSYGPDARTTRDGSIAS